MAFMFYAQDVAPMYRDFSERFVSGLALRGTEITGEKRGENTLTFDILYMGENGTVFLEPSNRDIKATYTVTREKKEIKRGLRGAVAGAGLGGVLGGALGSVMNKDGDGIMDSLTGALGGAAAGGAYEAYDGYEESRQDRTRFASVIAETMDEVGEELREILNAQEEGRRSRSEAVKEREREEQEAEDEMRSQADEAYGDLVALEEEVRFAEIDGRDMKRVKARIERANELYSEVDSAISDRNYSVAKAKLKALQSIVSQSQDMLYED